MPPIGSGVDVGVGVPGPGVAPTVGTGVGIGCTEVGIVPGMNQSVVFTPSG